MATPVLTPAPDVVDRFAEQLFERPDLSRGDIHLASDVLDTVIAFLRAEAWRLDLAPGAGHVEFGTADGLYTAARHLTRGRP